MFVFWLTFGVFWDVVRVWVPKKASYPAATGIDINIPLISFATTILSHPSQMESSPSMVSVGCLIRTGEWIIPMFSSESHRIFIVDGQRFTGGWWLVAKKNLFSQKYWVANHPNWLSYFDFHIFQRGGEKPPTSLSLMLAPHFVGKGLSTHVLYPSECSMKSPRLMVKDGESLTNHWVTIRYYPHMG